MAFALARRSNEQAISLECEPGDALINGPWHDWIRGVISGEIPPDVPADSSAMFRAILPSMMARHSPRKPSDDAKPETTKED